MVAGERDLYGNSVRDELVPDFDGRVAASEARLAGAAGAQGLCARLVDLCNVLEQGEVDGLVYCDGCSRVDGREQKSEKGLRAGRRPWLGEKRKARDYFVGGKPRGALYRCDRNCGVRPVAAKGSTIAVHVATTQLQQGIRLASRVRAFFFWIIDRRRSTCTRRAVRGVQNGASR